MFSLTFSLSEATDWICRKLESKVKREETLPMATFLQKLIAILLLRNKWDWKNIRPFLVAFHMCNNTQYKINEFHDNL